MRLNNSVIVTEKKAVSVFIEAIKSGKHSVLYLQNDGFRPLAWLNPEGVIEMQGDLLLKVAKRLINVFKDNNLKYEVMDNCIKQLYE